MVVSKRWFEFAPEFEPQRSQRALRDILMPRGKNWLPPVSRQFLTLNYPRANCLLKCLPNCLSPTREDIFSSFKIAPVVRVIARQLSGKNCLAAILPLAASRCFSGPSGKLNCKQKSRIPNWFYQFQSMFGFCWFKANATPEFFDKIKAGDPAVLVGFVWETPGQLQGSKTPKPENPRKKNSKNTPWAPTPNSWKKKNSKNTRKLYFLSIFSLFWVFFRNLGSGSGG